MAGYNKTYKNSDVSGAHDNVRDLCVVGDGDMFKLLCKAYSEKEGWMKSTKAMEIPHVGCVVQVTTQQGTHVAEALTFVPGVCIVDDIDNGNLRKLALLKFKVSKPTEDKGKLYDPVTGKYKYVAEETVSIDTLLKKR